MPAGGGDFQRALDRFLAFHIGEIEFVLVRLIEQCGQVHACRRNLNFSFKKTHGFAQILDGDDLPWLENKKLNLVFE